MIVKVRTAGFRMTLPVPLSMIGFVIRLMPERLFIEMNANTPEPYADLLTKDNVNMVLGECQDILRENKGLEIVHVEAADGTFVSIRI